MSPERHSAIFEATINSLLSIGIAKSDPYTDPIDPPAPRRFDLLTFPEAFLPASDLVDVLRSFKGFGPSGCVHVGLRPNASPGGSHLFPVASLNGLVASIRGIPGVHAEDLETFAAWVGAQRVDAKFNIACLFMVDAQGVTRVCLHPKIVRAAVELSGTADSGMVEADLLTVITLRPMDQSHLSINIQPLICADLLLRDTDHPGRRPLEGLMTDADCLGDAAPDHIDVVSVPTWTRQVETGSMHARAWHSDFQDSFDRAASDPAFGRHHFASFVLANFRSLPLDAPGGLSGAFMPVPLTSKDLPEFISLAGFGRHRESRGNNAWSTPGSDDIRGLQWSTRGYIASLDPHYRTDGTEARIFGFTIFRLPRHGWRWRQEYRVTDCDVRLGRCSGQPPVLTFSGGAP